MLLGLDHLNSFELFLRQTRDVLVSEKGWQWPVRKLGSHYYLRWQDVELALTGVAHSRIYSRRELRRLHRHFRHPSPQKLFNLLQSARLKDLPIETLRLIREITASCQQCQRFCRREVRFSSKLLREDLVFGRSIAVDLCWIDGKPVLHVVCEDTGFGAARFVRSKGKNPSSVEVWLTLLQCWILLYIGPPERLRHDPGTNFASREFGFLLATHGISAIPTPVEGHGQNGKVENAHQHLRKIYQRLRAEAPNLPCDLLLMLSRKAMNDVAGPDGLSPQLLAFGTPARDPYAGLPVTLEAQNVRFRLMERARSVYRSMQNNLRLKNLLRRQVAPAKDRTVDIGDSVLVWREEPGTHGTKGSYHGPYHVLETADSRIRVQNNAHAGTWFSLDQVKPMPDTPCALPTTEMLFTSTIRALVEKNRSRKAREARERRRRKHKRYTDAGVHVTEVLKPNDPRCHELRFDEAKRKELQGLLEKGTFRIVLRDEDPNVHVMKGRFVLALKHVGTEQEVAKARFVVQGFSDPRKTKMLHNATNLRQDSARLVMALAAIFGFRIWTQDVSQAFLQGCSQNMPKLNLQAPRELELDLDEVLQIMAPLYGLADSGDRWHHALGHHHISELEMTPTTTEPALFFKHHLGSLFGISGVYVDDMLRTGSDEFLTGATTATSGSFMCTPPSIGTASFAGVSFEQRSDRSVVANMHTYIQSLKFSYGSFRHFASNRAKLAWAVHCRPDVCATVAKLAQLTERDYAESPAECDDITRELLYYLKNTPDVVMTFPNLHSDSLHIRCYADASFASNRDGSSQLGYVLLLRDHSGATSLVGYKSLKSRRVTHSAMAAEACALAEAYDAAFALKHTLSQVLQRDVPVRVLVDSKQVFDSIAHSTRTKERRVVIDLASVKQGFERREIDLGLVESEHNLADCFSKPMAPIQLLDVLRTGIIDHPIVAWVLRDSKPPGPA